MKTERMVRISSKGQIVLPKRLRDKMGLHEGDYIAVREGPDGFLLLGKQGESALDSIARELRRAAKEKNFTLKDLDEAIREVRGKRPEE